MAFKQRNARKTIAGFWTREEGSNLTGTYVKLVDGDKGSYHLFELTSKGCPLMDKDSEKAGVTGDLVGVSDMAALKDARLEPGNLVKLISKGKRTLTKGAYAGQEFWDIEVFVDE